jgi:hypothetical protein
LTTKVKNILLPENGGTGLNNVPTDQILVGSNTGTIKPKILASSDNSLEITQTADSIILKSKLAATEVTSDPAGTFNVGNLPNGSTYISNAINSFQVSFGDIIIASIDKDLEGCMLTAYVSQPNVIRIAIFNGTGVNKSLGFVNVKVYIVK